jgi:hypothetical protein
LIGGRVAPGCLRLCRRGCDVAYRAAIAVYLVAGQHIERAGPSDRVKSVRQIARELDMSATTVSRWLKSNHRDLWLKYWDT